MQGTAGLKAGGYTCGSAGLEFASTDGMAHRRPRLPDRSYLGVRTYFLTICCARHAPLLQTDDLLGEVRTQFFRAAEQTYFKILAYCLLPDHVHLLINGFSEESDMRSFVKQAKQLSGFSYSRRRSGKLWQRSYHDRIVRPHECLGDIARYIVGNPVRAGLVTDSAAYPYAASSIAISTENVSAEQTRHLPPHA